MGSSPSEAQEPPPETGDYKRGEGLALLLQEHRSHHLKQNYKRGEGLALLLQKHRSHHLKQEAIRGEKEWLFSFRSTGATT